MSGVEKTVVSRGVGDPSELDLAEAKVRELELQLVQAKDALTRVEEARVDDKDEVELAGELALLLTPRAVISDGTLAQTLRRIIRERDEALKALQREARP